MRTAALEKLFEVYARQLGDEQPTVPGFLAWLKGKGHSELSERVRVAVVLEITRACGCMEIIGGKKDNLRAASLSETERRAATECYQCQLKKRRAERRT